MECIGCGEELNGVVQHAMHICPTPIVTNLMDAPVRDREEFIVPVGSAMYEAMQECMKELVEENGIRYKE